MTGAALLGSLPGQDLLEAQSTVLGELGGPGTVPEGVTGLPGMVQLSDGAPWSEPVARTAALLGQMPVELGPHGWRLADRPGRDAERLAAARRERVDVLAIAGHRYTGPLVVEVGGPWTTAASLYLARGDRVLSDRGAVRELVAGLAEGITDLLAAVVGVVPGVQPLVVLHEPRLADVLAGAVPDFSGHGRLWSIPPETARVALAELVGAVRAGGARAVLHAGPRPGADGLRTLLRCGADGIGVMVDGLGSAAWEQLAAAVEGGTTPWFGLPDPADGPVDTRAPARRVAGPWTAVGLPAGGLADAVVHGYSRGDPGALRGEIATTVQVAARLAETAADG